MMKTRTMTLKRKERIEGDFRVETHRSGKHISTHAVIIVLELTDLFSSTGGGI